MRFILIFLFCCLTSFYALAQDTLSEKMRWFNLGKPTTNLFVHFDKNVYANNETIWFTGYMLKSNVGQLNQHHVLAVALIRAADTTLILQKKYAMQDGIALGSIVLPDSILTGSYYLIATTNITVNGQPSALFVQPVTLKSNIDPVYKADMKLMPTVTAAQVLVSVTSRDDRFLPKATAINYKYGNVNKKAKTDASGQLLITIDPKNQLTDPNLYIKLKYENDSSFMQMALPVSKVKAQVKFYPEGGQLVQGLPSRVAWEVKDPQNRPLTLQAFLLKNNQVIDTIETDDYGIGKFKLLPETSAHYTVKLVHSNLADSAYVLPQPLEKGFVLAIEQALVKDTLKLHLSSNLGRKLIVRVHNFRESFLYFPLDMGYAQRSIKIPLHEVPKGLVALTLADSLDRPLAERLFFAHYDPQQKIELATNQESYQQREKVTLKLKLNEAEEKAAVSIACVQDNRIDPSKMTDIESFTYLNQELGALPLLLKGSAITNSKYLEQLLLVKGWRKYTWQELQQTKASDTLFKLDSLKIGGYITKNRKPLSKEINFSFFGNNNFNLISTTDHGRFELKTQDLFTTHEKKTYLFVNEKNKFPYAFHLKDDFNVMHLKIAKNLPETHITLPSNIINTTDLLLKNDEKTIRLKEIVVTNKDRKGRSYGSNRCGDYVCAFNILNCPNHIGDANNFQPVKWEVYYTPDEGLKEYLGCDPVDPTFFVVDPLYLHKDFYLYDYKDPQEPAYFSTIYWNYAAILTAGKETELSFYTSDITGKFRVIVQGVTYKGVTYAEHTFEVKRNQP